MCFLVVSDNGGIWLSEAAIDCDDEFLMKMPMMMMMMLAKLLQDSPYTSCYFELLALD